MKGSINNEQIEYVFFHLNQSLDIHEKIKERIVIIKDSAEIKNHKGKIIFQLSDKPMDISLIKWIDKIPILFSISKENFFYELKNDNLVFTDDILKSAFYLLSGYQEYNSKGKDMFGRFPFKRSIQYALGIVDKPVVNYYFVEIANGIKQFCDKEKIAFEKKKLFQNFGFMLTHDVDRVDAYNYYNVGYIFKQLIGLSTPDYNKIKTLKVFISSFYHFINIFSKKNPFWSFEFLRQVEKDNNFKSVFYFLKNEGKLDARYSIREKRIINLLGYLSEEGCEIGLHGTMNSALHFESMNNALKELKQVTQREIIGCRQHFLKFHLPETMLIQEKCNIKYDSTLCFAEHDGFRNSYCLPFKLYHFDENRMMDVWEIPLNTMEVTLFGYRKLSFKEANDSVIQLISEIKKFNGIFTLLWHNCFYDENKYKGIRYFYEQLIFNIRKEMPENVLGKELVVTLNREHKKNIF